MGNTQPSRDPLLQQFLELLVKVRARPEDYCATLGELAEFLHRLYDLCAAADGNAAGFARALSAALAVRGQPDVDSLLTADERPSSLGQSESAARELIAFWTSLDEPLNFPSPPAR